MSDLFDKENDGVVSEEDNEDAFMLMADDGEIEETHSRTDGCLTILLLVVGSIMMVLKTPNRFSYRVYLLVR